MHTHSHRVYNTQKYRDTHDFQQVSRNRDMLTSAEDVRWDAEARLGFLSWDWLWLARMLMLGRLFCLCFSLHKIFCFIWASNQAFHHLLAHKCVAVTKETFWQSAKTDCHISLVFKRSSPYPLLPLTGGPLISSHLRKLNVRNGKWII